MGRRNLTAIGLAGHGAARQQGGHVARVIRSSRGPEPNQGPGINPQDEDLQPIAGKKK